MLSRVKLLAAAALVVVGASACSDLVGFDGTADGTYFLHTINGDPLPYSYSNAGATFTVQSSTYALNTNGTYDALVTYSVTDNSGTFTESLTESGDWSLSGNTVTFTVFQSDAGDSGTYRATMSNSSTFGGTRTLRTTVNGLTAIYSD